MLPIYKYTKFHEVCFIINWNISIQNKLLKISIFQFLFDVYFYFIFHIYIIYNII